MRDLIERASVKPAIFAAMAGAGAVLLAGVPLVLVHDFGPLSQHMLLHILTMNVVAPMAAALLVAVGKSRTIAPRLLWAIAVAQIIALWFLHTPRFHFMAGHVPAIGLTMHALLACLALAFWTALLSLSRTQRWHAPIVLFVTGKLACLLAAFLIFSPRLLYASVDHAAHMQVSIADQQLAGLLMIVACPLSYLATAVLLTLDLIGPRGSGEASPETQRHAG